MSQQSLNRSLILRLSLRVDLPFLDRVPSQCFLGRESFRGTVVVSHCLEEIVDVNPNTLQGLYVSLR